MSIILLNILYVDYSSYELIVFIHWSNPKQRKIHWFWWISFANQFNRFLLGFSNDCILIRNFFVFFRNYLQNGYFLSNIKIRGIVYLELQCHFQWSSLYGQTYWYHITFYELRIGGIDLPVLFLFRFDCCCCSLRRAQENIFDSVPAVLPLLLPLCAELLPSLFDRLLCVYWL